MKKPQITIKNIARTLNICLSTVLCALKNHPDISQDINDAANKYAEDFHYKPYALALSLGMSKNITIGVNAPEIIHFFFTSILSGILARLSKHTTS